MECTEANSISYLRDPYKAFLSYNTWKKNLYITQNERIFFLSSSLNKNLHFSYFHLCVVICLILHSTLYVFFFFVFFFFFLGGGWVGLKGLPEEREWGWRQRKENAITPCMPIRTSRNFE